MLAANCWVEAAESFGLAAGAGEGPAAVSLHRLALQTSPQAVARELEGLATAEAAAAAEGPALRDFVHAVLVGTRPGLVGGEAEEDARRRAMLRLFVYDQALALLSEADTGLDSGDAKQLVAALDDELGSTAQTVHVWKITEAAVEAFETDAPHATAALDLLPRALSMLQGAGGEMHVAGDDGSTMPCQVSDMAQGIIRRICQHTWPLDRIAAIVQALRDFPLTKDNLGEMVRKAVGRAVEAQLADLPGIAHQLLMLSTRGCRELVLRELVHLFDCKDAAEGDAPPLLLAEGAVLLQLDLAVKHDGELGQAWLRLLRSDGPQPTAFMLAVSFMLAGVERFEQAAVDSLKSLVLAAYKDAAMHAAAPWLPPAQAADPGAAAEGRDALRQAMLRCVQSSEHWQASLVKPMVQLAGMLLEASGSVKGAAACYEADGTLEADAAQPALKAGDLGTHMLLQLFALHREYRRDIISLCLTRLIGAKDEVAAPYVRLLALLVRHNGALVADYLSDFKVSLENLVFLPPNAALSLLLAVWPMCRERPDIQSYMITLLRKAMFSRELHARLLAARGFLYMITEELFKAGGGRFAEDGGIQMSMSQMGSLSAATGGVTLLHELMGFLRRCLTQQPEVRRVLYDGLPVLLAADPTAQESVVEPLLPHFCQFYEMDERLSPPLKLEACAKLQGDRVRLIEPLQHLLACMRRVLGIAPPGLGTGSFKLPDTERSPLGEEGAAAASEALRKCFTSLRTRMVECTLEGFQFDRSTDFTMALPGGELSHSLADLLLGCMEVVIEDMVEEVADGSAPEGAAMSLLTIYQQHQRLVDLATSAKGSRGKKPEGLTQAVAVPAKRSTGRQPAAAVAAAAAAQQAPVVAVDKRVPALSIPCLVKLLNAVVDDGLVGSNAEGADGADASTMAVSAHLKLARDPAFRTFVLSACLRVLQSAHSSDLAGAIATGTAGSSGDAATVRELFAVPDWQELAAPLFRVVQTTVLARAAQRNVPAAGGKKKEKDPSEALVEVAVKALDQLLSMRSTAAGVADLLQPIPAPAGSVVDEAALPPAVGLTLDQATIVERLPLFKQLFDSLVQQADARRLETMCSTLQQLAVLLPPSYADAVSGWAVAACESDSLSGLQQQGTAKALLQLALRCKGAAGGGDLPLLRSFAEELGKILNAEEVQDSEKYPLLSSRTVNAAVGVVVVHLEAALSSLDWALGRLRAMAPSGAKDAPLPSRRAVEALRGWEVATYQRLQGVAEAAVVLVGMRLASGASESALKLAAHLFKLLGAAAKAQLAPKGVAQHTPCQSFEELVGAVNRSCTAAVYAFISEVNGQQAAENDGAAGNAEGGKRKARGGAAAAASKVRRESKIIPNLIFQIEDYEKHLIRLTKTGKINLMLSAKRAVNRDFKITLAPAAGGGGGGAPLAKRAREESVDPAAAYEEAAPQPEDEEMGEEEEEEEEEQGEETEGEEETAAAEEAAGDE